MTETEFAIRSGLALLYPVYKGTYERQAPTSGPIGLRDLTIARVKDVSRVIDYVESRPDLDRTRVGYFGLSLGSFNGVISAAIEPRIRAAALMGAGLPSVAYPPEIDGLNFAPRVTIRR